MSAFNELVEEALLPYQKERFDLAACDHLAEDLSARDVSVGMICVSHRAPVLCNECAVRHLDEHHPPGACLECGGASGLRSAERYATLQLEGDRRLLVRLSGPWICRECSR